MVIQVAEVEVQAAIEPVGVVVPLLLTGHKMYQILCITHISAAIPEERL